MPEGLWGVKAQMRSSATNMCGPTEQCCVAIIHLQSSHALAARHGVPVREFGYERIVDYYKLRTPVR